MRKSFFFFYLTNPKHLKGSVNIFCDHCILSVIQLCLTIICSFAKSVTCVWCVESESLFKAGKNETKTVLSPSDSLIFVHHAIKSFTSQYFGDSSRIHSCVKGYDCHQMRGSIPAAQLPFLCQHLSSSTTQRSLGLQLMANL